jgi:hypothetical protein
MPLYYLTRKNYQNCCVRWVAWLAVLGANVSIPLTGGIGGLITISDTGGNPALLTNAGLSGTVITDCEEIGVDIINTFP